MGEASSRSPLSHIPVLRGILLQTTLQRPQQLRLEDLRESLARERIATFLIEPVGRLAM
jgi:hypothetical protein